MSYARTMPNTALILRTCYADMTSRGGFKWPRRGKVEAPDWEPTHECGNGLHGLLWGEGGEHLLDWSKDAVWVVARVDMDDVINLGDKVKFPRATVLYAGDRKTATDRILKERPGAACVGAFITGGDFATVAGGDFATVAGGYFATVAGGDYATVTGGYRSTVTGGGRATVTGGDGSVLQLRHHDGRRRRIVIAYVGEDGIKPDTPYRLIDGKFTETNDA
jgi:hypothetical protein